MGRDPGFVPRVTVLKAKYTRTEGGGGSPHTSKPALTVRSARPHRPIYIDASDAELHRRSLRADGGTLFSDLLRAPLPYDYAFENIWTEDGPILHPRCVCTHSSVQRALRAALPWAGCGIVFPQTFRTRRFGPPPTRGGVG